MDTNCNKRSVGRSVVNGHSCLRKSYVMSQKPLASSQRRTKKLDNYLMPPDGGKDSGCDLISYFYEIDGLTWFITVPFLEDGKSNPFKVFTTRSTVKPKKVFATSRYAYKIINLWLLGKMLSFVGLGQPIRNASNWPIVTLVFTLNAFRHFAEFFDHGNHDSWLLHFFICRRILLQQSFGSNNDLHFKSIQEWFRSGIRKMLSTEFFHASLVQYTEMAKDGLHYDGMINPLRGDTKTFYLENHTTQYHLFRICKKVIRMRNGKVCKTAIYSTSSTFIAPTD